jgi:hypothetical protein
MLSASIFLSSYLKYLNDLEFREITDIYYILNIKLFI